VVVQFNDVGIIQTLVGVYFPVDVFNFLLGLSVLT